MDSMTASMMSFNISVEGIPMPDFVNPDPKYKCTKCSRVLNMPRQMPCGHRICRGCVEELFSSGEGTIMCPSSSGDEECKTRVKRDQIYPDMSAQRELKNLVVYCIFKQNGCLETMPWAKYKAHVEQCKYRTQRCKYCRIEISLTLMQNHIENECQAIEILCPYGCENLKIIRAKMNEHLKICPNKPEPCFMQEFGCNFMGVRRELESHSEDHLHHLKLLTLRVRQLEDEVANVKSKETGGVPRRPVELDVEFDARPTHSNELELLRNKTVQLEQMVQQTSLSLKSLSGAEQNELKKLEERVGSIESASGERRLGIADMKKQMEERNAQVAELTRIIADLRSSSTDGVYVWKVTSFRRLMSLAREGRGPSSYYSTPFYTHRYGYKLCGRVYLNGDGSGRGSHVSLFVVVMQGEYDDILPWPFGSKVTLTILDQSSSRHHISETFMPDPKSSSFEKPKELMNVACGCPKFVSHELLENATDSCDSEGRMFVQNDNVFFRIVVDTINMKSL